MSLVCLGSSTLPKYVKESVNFLSLTFFQICGVSGWQDLHPSLSLENQIQFLGFPHWIFGQQWVHLRLVSVQTPQNNHERIKKSYIATYNISFTLHDLLLSTQYAFTHNTYSFFPFPKLKRWLERFQLENHYIQRIVDIRGKSLPKRNEGDHRHLSITLPKSTRT